LGSRFLLPAYKKSSGKQVFKRRKQNVRSHTTIFGQGYFTEELGCLQLAVDAVDAAKFQTITADPHVTLEACFLVVARAKVESIKLADQGHFKEAADLLEKYSNALRSLNLSNPALNTELDELELRAEQLRRKGNDSYTAREKKRMHYEADMMSKNRMVQYSSMQ
jgi:hypothetical protein